MNHFVSLLTVYGCFYTTYMLFIHNVNSVPIDYCMYELNKTNCGLPPVPVFTYYRPGSRCEIEYWRGCPTHNKFDNQYKCSNSCIGRFYGQSDVAELDLDNINVRNDDTPECFQALNTGSCTSQTTKVYTFDMSTQSCVEKFWHGCETKNKFDDEESCMLNCGPVVNWEKILKDLSPQTIKDINHVLDKVLQDEVTHKTPLKKITNHIHKKIIPNTTNITEETTPTDEIITHAPEEPTPATNNTAQSTEKIEDKTTEPVVTTHTPGDVTEVINP